MELTPRYFNNFELKILIMIIIIYENIINRSNLFSKLNRGAVDFVPEVPTVSNLQGLTVELWFLLSSIISAFTVKK